MGKYVDIDSEHDVPLFSTACRRDMHGGGNGVVTSRHGEGGMEKEADNRFAGTGRTPKVERDRGVDEGMGKSIDTSINEDVVSLSEIFCCHTV